MEGTALVWDELMNPPPPANYLMGQQSALSMNNSNNL